MPETPHIKRFEDYGAVPPSGFLSHVPESIEEASYFKRRAIDMLSDLAEHIERLEARLSTIEYNLNMVPPDLPSLSNP